MSGRANRAEDMLMALSTFFRTSLSLDPSADVSLAEEIDLQRPEVVAPNAIRGAGVVDVARASVEIDVEGPRARLECGERRLRLR